MIDLRRLASVIDRLGPDDGAWLSGILEPAWRQRERRTAETAAAARAAAETLGPMPRTRAAKALERTMTRYLASAWRADCITGQPAPSNATLFRLARATDGRGLGWRRVVDLLPCITNGLQLQKSPDTIATQPR